LSVYTISDAEGNPPSSLQPWETPSEEALVAAEETLAPAWEAYQREAQYVDPDERSIGAECPPGTLLTEIPDERAPFFECAYNPTYDPYFDLGQAIRKLQYALQVYAGVPIPVDGQPTSYLFYAVARVLGQAYTSSLVRDILRDPEGYGLIIRARAEGVTDIPRYIAISRRVRIPVTRVRYLRARQAVLSPYERHELTELERLYPRRARPRVVVERRVLPERAPRMVIVEERDAPVDSLDRHRVIRHEQERMQELLKRRR